MPILFFESIGWLGMILILVAYWLVSIRKITPTSNIYQFLNLLGAAFVIVNVAFHGALPSVALNVVWFLIALFGLAKKQKF
jgi:hypothetical protein